MADHRGHPLMQRFSGFVEKIFGRLTEIQAESSQGLIAMRQAAPTDYQQFATAMSGLDHRVSQLEDKLESMWDGEVEPKFEEAEEGGARGLHDAGLDLKSWARIEIAARWAQWKAKENADFHRALEPHARADMQRVVTCSQCASPLSNPDPLTMQSIQCASCRAVNQVAPTAVINAWAGAPTAYADEQTVSMRFDIERFRREVDIAQRDKRMKRDDYSGEGLASLQRWEQMERAYWTRHAELVAHWSGRPVDHALVQARMKQFYMYTLEMEQDWVRAHGRMSQQM
jgi:hypothetical protein